MCKWTCFGWNIKQILCMLKSPTAACWKMYAHERFSQLQHVPAMQMKKNPIRIERPYKWAGSGCEYPDEDMKKVSARKWWTWNLVMIFLPDPSKCFWSRRNMFVMSGFIPSFWTTSTSASPATTRPFKDAWLMGYRRYFSLCDYQRRKRDNPLHCGNRSELL